MLYVRCPEPWTSKGRGSAVTPGARGEPRGLAGEEKRRHSRMGETLMVTMKSLLKMQILGVTWLNEAREVEALPGDLSLPALPSGDVGRAVGGRRSLLGVPGRWAACEPGCGALVPVLVEDNEPAAHENCEIQPCAGTGCA